MTAVDRAARVLAAFSQSWDFLSLPEVTARAGLSKPTTFRILATLISEGLIFQNEANATYGFGFQTLRLADVVLGTIPCAAAAQLAMRNINATLNETVVLSVQHKSSCFFVDGIETTQSIGHTHVLGVPMPLHSVAPGRAMLATWPDSEVRQYLETFRGVDAKREATALLREIDAIRAQGFARSSGELFHGGCSIATAFPRGEAPAHAALHVAFPQGRYTPDLEARCIQALRDACDSAVRARRRP